MGAWPPLDAFENSIMLSILGECALALKNDKVSKEREAAALMAKNEQLRANLLRSISHDLRTPLKNEELHLTPIEYKLLCLLAKNVGKVLTHTYITKEIWGSAWDNDVASLRVFMATLRKKIEADPSNPQYIQTHIGVGYRMLKV